MNSLVKTTTDMLDPFTGLFPSIFGDDFFADFRDNFATRGLKKIIQRPHDLTNVKDKDGNVVGQKLSLVYTPFKKDQIKVTVEGNVLSVAIGDEKKEEKQDENGEIVYKGISTQSTRFALNLTDKIDKNLINAKAEDGMLHIDLPFVKEEKKEPKAIEISVQ
jgi:HSP20 family molecular chaperone IbpA